MTKIFHKIRGEIKLKLDKIEKILTWPISQDQIVVKVFLGTI